MKLLIIGGTRFLGRHLAQLALERGHALTLFHRGRSGAAPEGAQVLIGDRHGDLSPLLQPGAAWDAVIDTCGYRPAEVTRMAAALHGRVGRYLFVSSISVYADMARPNDESGALAVIDDPETEVVDGRSYGALKAACERAAAAACGAAATLVVRPGLIVGPHDPTQRFTYWPARIARAAAGEPVLVPGAAEDPLQFIDVRDLALFMLQALEQGRHGVFNASSVPRQFTVGALLQACADAAGTAPSWCWADAAALQRLQLRFWSDLPVWVPPQGDTAGVPLTSVDAALAAGLRLRPLRDTVQATLDWWHSLPPAQQAFTQAGLTPEREREALRALQSAA